MDKRTLVEQLRSEVARELAVLTRAARAAHEAATHEESRPENDKDTRAVEAAYLAGAQAERVRDLRDVDEALAGLRLHEFGAADPIALAALVTVETDGSAAHYLLCPRGGGLVTRAGEVTVQVLTPGSPLGRALLGRTAGDVVEVEVQRKRREYAVTAVR